jgi:hypothetical protein
MWYIMDMFIMRSTAGRYEGIKPKEFGNWQLRRTYEYDIL